MSILPAAGLLLFGACLALLAAGCESTQEKSAKLEKQGGQSFSEKGLRIRRASRDVKVLDKAVLSDRNGAAAVARLKNVTKRTLVRVPVAIDVRGRKQRSLFRNDQPGVEPSLVGFALMRPGQAVWWVHDQVFATGKPRGVSVKPGEEAGRPPAKLPEIDVGPAKLVDDPTSGVAAEGKVTNRSKLLQKKLVVFGVARRGSRVVAAGRSQIERLRPGKTATYQIFFIGNPRGARIELAAPPTALG